MKYFITPEDKKRLHRFSRVVNSLKNSKFLKETKPVVFQINFDSEKGLRQGMEDFDEESFRSALMDIRKIISPSEGIYIGDICDILIKEQLNQDIVNNIKNCKISLERIKQEPAIKLIINEKNRVAEDTLFDWMYGLYLHEDENRQARLKSFEAVAPVDKYNFVLTCKDLVYLAIVILNNI
jgi:hypothetical protein